MTNFGEDSQISSNGQRQPTPTGPHHPSMLITTLMQRWFFFFWGGARNYPTWRPNKSLRILQSFFLENNGTKPPYFEEKQVEIAKFRP
jgi:hypothetical protein